VAKGLGDVLSRRRQRLHAFALYSRERENVFQFHGGNGEILTENHTGGSYRQIRAVMEIYLPIREKRVPLRYGICPIFIIYFGQNKNDFYMESIENKIENSIKRQRRGKLFFAGDFALCGNIEAVFKALQRLHKSGLIMRVAHGIYYYPKSTGTNI
jgi:hypothetical protein